MQSLIAPRRHSGGRGLRLLQFCKAFAFAARFFALAKFFEDARQLIMRAGIFGIQLRRLSQGKVCLSRLPGECLRLAQVVPGVGVWRIQFGGPL
jgi:hypothetical protein